MRPFFDALQQIDEIEYHLDDLHRRIYSVDASIYEVLPLAVVIPKSIQALIETVKLAHFHKVPVIPRGGATGITGGCIGEGVILDLSKYLTKIIEVNVKEEYVICEPGVIQDDLNAELAPHGYRLGPDTSTGNRATVGGMLANNSAGAHSLRYGAMADHILEVDLILDDGSIFEIAPMTTSKWSKTSAKKTREGRIYKTIDDIRRKYKQEIEKRFPKMPRRVSGYNLDRNDYNLAPLIAGSEGTLGVVSKLKLKISPMLKERGLCLIPFNSMEEGFNVAATLHNLPLLSLEMIDEKIMEAGDRVSWLPKIPKMLIIAEVDGKDTKEVRTKLQYAQAFLNKETNIATTLLTTPEEMQSFWKMRKSGLGLLLSKRTYARAIAFIEDIAVPPQNLASFMKKFTVYLKSVNKEAGVYGHIGAGCLHIRPYIDLRDDSERHLMQEIIEKVSDMILEEGGAMSGEHGDGFVRTWLNKKMFGKEIYAAFKEVKEAFDPEHLMNPHKIVEGPSFLQNLRHSPLKEEPETFLDFSKEGGFNLAVDMCNGNGSCRKPSGLMCPSFQATRNEYDSTRARAQSLRSMIENSELSSKPIQEVLDLCLECKGCKTECPSQVDMAKMKSEALYQYQEKHGYGLRNRLFAYLPKLFKIASPLAPLVNKLSEIPWLRWQLERFGITSKRPLPKLAQKTFSSWFANHPQVPNDKKVVLFNDTYTEFIEPDVGRAAVSVLQTLGFEVILPPWSCCGKPMISKGLLKEAKAQALQTFETLKAYEHPIVGLEPSCLLAMKDDYPSLIGEECPFYTFDEFVAEHSDEKSFAHLKGKVAVHGHCHQKALIGMTPTLSILQKIPNLEVYEIPSGCCGMAGSFGYEHYELSQKIGNLVLFPTLEKLPEDYHIIASGFSCRCQIENGTNRKGMHLAKFLSNLS